MSARYGRLRNAAIRNCTLEQIHTGVDESTASTGYLDSQYNRFEDLTLSSPAAGGSCYVADGSDDGTSSHNIWSNIRCLHRDGDGFQLNNSADNLYEHISFEMPSPGVGISLHLTCSGHPSCVDSASSRQSAREEVFVDVAGNGGTTVVQDGAANGNVMYGLKIGGGNAKPMVLSGSFEWEPPSSGAVPTRSDQVSFPVSSIPAPIPTPSVTVDNTGNGTSSTKSTEASGAAKNSYILETIAASRAKSRLSSIPRAVGGSLSAIASLGNNPIDVRTKGAVGDGKIIPDNCAIKVGDNLVTCTGSAASPPLIATAPPFASTDVGKVFWMPGAGKIGPNSYLVATITKFINPSQVRLSANASNTVTKSTASFGHDNYAAFCSISNCTSASVPNNWYGWPQTGRQIYLPAGMYLTSHPIYVRNGDMWWGDGQTASQVRLMSAANSVMAVCMNGNASAGTDTCTLDSFADGASQTTTVRGLFLANGSMNTDYIKGPVGIYVAPGTSNYNIYDSWFDMSSVAIFAKNANGGMIVDNLCDTSTGLSCIVLDGTYASSENEYTSNQFSTTISGLQTWAGFNSITLHGVIGVTVEGLQSMFIVAEDINIGASQSPLANPATESSRRVVVTDSFFQRSENPSYLGDPNDSFIVFREDCVSCTISNNTFANSSKYDIGLFQTSPLLNVDGLLITENQFKDSEQLQVNGPGYPSIFLGNIGNRSQITISNNHWEDIGSYAVWSNESVNLLGNMCHNPFLRSTPANGGIAANTCFYLADGAVHSMARDNVTDSTSYGAVGVATAGSYGASLDSSGNRSDSSLCDVCVADDTGGVIKSVNERASNSGSSANNAFTANTTAGAIDVGGLLVGGIAVIDRSRNATVQNLTVNGTCVGCSPSGFTGTKQIGACSLTIQSGVIIGISGC